MRLDAAAIHARLAGGGWAAVLCQLGVAEEFTRLRRQQPCPVCGGRDRFVYDDRNGRGDHFCRSHGGGDGFKLLQLLHGWDFRTAMARVAEVAGISADPIARAPLARAVAAPDAPASPTRRVREIRRATCAPEDVADVREYLGSRGVWPLPVGCALRAHASTEYWQGRERLGCFAALIADVRDLAGELVTLHVTYLAGGKKLTDHEPRKMLSPLTGRDGCAVRLMPLIGDTLGIAEGIETALSASALNDALPTWAALNTSLLGKFEPPPEVRRLVVFADRDIPGFEAATRLMERLQGRVRLELRAPQIPHKDWNDALRARAARKTLECSGVVQ